jgi:hypothetical protein
MMFGMRPTPPHGERADGCSVNGVVQVRDGARQIEQHIILPAVAGQVFQFTKLNDANADLARVMGDDLVGKVERAYESSRRCVRDNFAGPIRGTACKWIANIWECHTVKSANFLRDIAFPVIMNGCGAPDTFWPDMFARVDAAAPRVNSILLNDDNSAVGVWDGNPTYVGDAIQAWREEQDRIAREAQHAAWLAARGDEYEALNADREKRQSFVGKASATGRAVELLTLVCGRAAADEYIEHGRVTVKSEGYEFRIEPGHGNIKVIDPKGKTARLCIGAFNAVNVIDDVVIAVLNLQHNFAEFFGTANIFNRQQGFQIPKGVKRNRDFDMW